MAAISVDRPITTPSNLLRRMLCPGSARMERGLSERDSTDARKGRLIHRYWANPNYNRSFLKADERDLLDLSDRLLHDVLNVLAFETDHVTLAEQTFTTHDGRLTGTPDRVLVWDARDASLIVDLKSGFVPVERAELNMQLRGYAVIEQDNFSSSSCHVSILQPRLWSQSERISLALYNKPDINKARQQINSILDASEKPDAPLKAGEEQCRFCKAKLICPAFRTAVNLPLAAFKSEKKLSKTRREIEIEKRLKLCTDEQLERVLEAVSLANRVDEAAHAEARQRIRDGGFKNFTLGEEYDVRKITNVRDAIALLSLSGVATREQLLDLCKLPLHELEDNYRSRNKGMTWQRARNKINKVLESVIEKEPREPKILPRKK